MIKKSKIIRKIEENQIVPQKPSNWKREGKRSIVRKKARVTMKKRKMMTRSKKKIMKKVMTMKMKKMERMRMKTKMRKLSQNLRYYHKDRLEDKECSY